MRYLLDLPKPVVASNIAVDLDCQIRQRAFFQRRSKLGPEITPDVYQPIIEPEKGWLCAIFVAPGENHLVFRDEVAPSRLWDEWYRELRIRNLGRASDIESLEITENKVVYYWCYSFANLYETGMHYSGRQDWTGSIYSATWNHMLANKAQLPVLLRGGYRKMEPEVYHGDRDDAEEYARAL